MRCAWNELLAVLPQSMRHPVDMLGRDSLQELRLRMGKAPELVTAGGCLYLSDPVTAEQLRFVVNTASRYSPWAAATTQRGYITAPGGHRIGLCGEVIRDGSQTRGLREISSLCVRVARDIPGVADGITSDENILILGPPGSGKTTLLRDLARSIAEKDTVCVVDERAELFPDGFATGCRMDVLKNCGKAQGVEMALRTMSPDVIAVDEITAAEDTRALESAAWCGVRLVATAHAACREDLLRRGIYRPLAEQSLFSTLLILRRDKSWYMERMNGNG